MLLYISKQRSFIVLKIITRLLNLLEALTEQIIAENKFCSRFFFCSSFNCSCSAALFVSRDLILTRTSCCNELEKKRKEKKRKEKKRKEKKRKEKKRKEKKRKEKKRKEKKRKEKKRKEKKRRSSSAAI